MADFKNLLLDWNSNYFKTLKTILLDEENQNFMKEMFTAEDGGILNILGNNSESSLKF